MIKNISKICAVVGLVSIATWSQVYASKVQDVIASDATSGMSTSATTTSFNVPVGAVSFTLSDNPTYYIDAKTNSLAGTAVMMAKFLNYDVAVVAGGPRRTLINMSIVNINNPIQPKKVSNLLFLSGQTMGGLSYPFAAVTVGNTSNGGLLISAGTTTAAAGALMQNRDIEFITKNILVYNVYTGTFYAVTGIMDSIYLN